MQATGTVGARKRALVPKLNRMFSLTDLPSGYANNSEFLDNLEGLRSELETGLTTMGLTRNESRVYAFLARTGAKKAGEAAKSLNLPRTETYNILNNLQRKGLVSSTMHHPVRFVALPFHKALNTLLGIEKQRFVALERQSETLLDVWSSIVNQEVTCEGIEEEKFQILEGRNSIYRKIADMVSSSKKEVIIMADQKELIKLYRNEVTDYFRSLTAKGVDVKILTSVEPSFEILEEIKRCVLKILPSGNNLNYVIVDKQQLLLFMKDNSDGRAPVIWTDCESLVRCILFLFEILWKRN